MTTNPNFTFRRAKIEDISAVRQMIQELADFEKMSDGPKITEKDLIRDAGLDGGQEYCHIYVLDLQTEEQSKPVIIGYSICFYSYSTWEGKAYFLEDIYVRPAYRNLGAGSYIFRSVAAKAKEYNCQRLDFHVLGWNPARKFYEKMGAIDLTESEDWHFYRLNSQEIEKLANTFVLERATGNKDIIMTSFGAGLSTNLWRATFDSFLQFFAEIHAESLSTLAEVGCLLKLLDIKWSE